MITSTRKAQRPKWNVGNFSFYNEVLQNYADAQPFANVWSQIAQVSVLQASTDPYAGRAIRFIDIGGIVIHSGFLPSAPPSDNSSWDGYDPTINVQQALVVDRVGADGAPIAVEWDMLRSTQPVASTAVSGTQQDDLPTRILRRWGGVQTYEYNSLGGTSTDRIIPQTDVAQNRWSHNLRLKLRLDADHGLYFVQSVRRYSVADGDLPLERGARHWAFGTVYYRFVE